MILAIQVEHMKKCVIKPLLRDAPIFFPPRKKEYKYTKQLNDNLSALIIHLNSNIGIQITLT